MMMHATTLLCAAAMLALAALPLRAEAHGASRGHPARISTGAAPAATSSGYGSRAAHHHHHHRHHHVAPRVVVVSRVVAAYVPPPYVPPPVVYVPATVYVPAPAYAAVPVPPPAAAPPASTGWFNIGGPFQAIDGASFVAGGVTYVLSGIRAFDPGSPHGAAARARLQHLLDSGGVQVWRLAYDAYGRAIARVAVNGADLSQVLRNEGFARV